MSRLTCTYHGQYDYRGLHGCPSHCWLHLFTNDFYTVVIASEVGTNPGTSVTNIAEGIATQVVRDWKLIPQQLTWIEHYPWGEDIWKRAQTRGKTPREFYTEHDIGEETFSHVIFGPWTYDVWLQDSRFMQVQWRCLPREAVEGWIRQPLPETLTTLVGH